MESIIIVLQRTELNYIIKYDASRISLDRIINFSYHEFVLLTENKQVSFLQNSFPIYEQEHEVILIEYDRKLIGYDNSPTITFGGILSIIPLTENGARLLASKLNIDFNVLAPLDAKTYKSFVQHRNHILRIKSAEALCSLYQVPFAKDNFVEDFRAAILIQLNESRPTSNDSTLAHLVDFNVTPSFIPEGNIEALIKSSCVAMKKLDRPADQITKSLFFSLVINEKETINSESLYEAIRYLEEKIELDVEGKEKFYSLTETLSEKGKYENAFLIFTYFYFLKKVIEKADYDVSIAKDTILELKHHDLNSASKVLFMLGYTFSIQTISKSIQTYSQNTLLKTKRSLDLKWSPKAIKEDKHEFKNVSNDSIEKEGLRFLQDVNDSELRNEDAPIIKIPTEKVANEIRKEIYDIRGSSEDKQENTIAEPYSILESSRSEPITLFDNSENVSEPSVESVQKVEVYKTVSELQEWLEVHKNLTKTATPYWEKFFKEDFKDGAYSFKDITAKIENKKLQKKLTTTMVKELNYFFSG